MTQSTPVIVLLACANMPLAQATGGRNVTSEFFDNAHRAAGPSNVIPYYDFIHGEPSGYLA